MIGPEWLPRLAGVIVLPPSGPLISKIPDFPALPSSFQKPQDTTQTIRLPTELPPLENSVSMQPDLQAQIDQALFDYDNMASAPQLEKLHQILMLYTQGDEHAVEGIKLTYISLSSAQAKIRELDLLQQTLHRLPAQKIGDQFQKINDALMELTRLLFPIDPEMACELVKEQYRCEMQ
ncbi:hypothetical protein HO173_008594 [Letharia columbiana]|uniref:Uncharacterized protein n=1 Tax=Letharia columbiana TaxID=112416 RepID=A0A8H6FRE6_9LECA|nr:uncharacterized protein HO173_008594 [Letharia columbiana]KAF6233302.1 hypothetical protein HO173_008594 [Letharia columbiana]